MSELKPRTRLKPVDPVWLKKVKKAQEKIEDFESYYKTQGVIPWESFPTPIGELYWAEVSSGRIRLFVENQETPVLGLSGSLRIIIADALPELPDAN